MTTFVRTTEGALRRYEGARAQLQRSADTDSFVEYLRGLDDMELAFMALNRAMRLAEALKASSETCVGNRELPREAERDQLHEIRNAIDHNVGPILDHDAGRGHTLALLVREDDVTIDAVSDSGKVTTHTVPYAVLGRWLRNLHELALALINDPERWGVRT